MTRKSLPFTAVSHMARRLARAAALCVALPVASLGAQASRPLADADSNAPSCAYVDCALGIAPVWNGLAVVRGPSRMPVANLDFFWPRSLHGVFVGDSARAYAERAVRTRRVAAAFTDAGALLAIAGAVRGARDGRLAGTALGMTLAGAAAFVVSVPLQFSADGALSSAVWWHNRAFAR